MTKPEAKAVMMEVWGYFAAHPECGSKLGLPGAMLRKIESYLYYCPLCELNEYEKTAVCENCILFKAGAECGRVGSPFDRWRNAPKGKAGNTIRAASAKKIFDISEAWDTEEE
jgi:hypothetical protein